MSRSQPKSKLSMARKASWRPGADFGVVGKAAADEERGDDDEDGAARDQAVAAQRPHPAHRIFGAAKVFLEAGLHAFPDHGGAGAGEGKRNRADDRLCKTKVCCGSEPFSRRVLAAAATAQSGHHAERDEGETEIGEAGNEKSGADHQPLGLPSVTVGVEDGLQHAPGGMRGETEDDEPDEDRAEGLPEERRQRAFGILGLGVAEGAEHGEEADDEIDNTPRRVARPRHGLEERRHSAASAWRIAFQMRSGVAGMSMWRDAVGAVERIDDGVHHGRGGADRAGLPGALDADGVGLRRDVAGLELEERQVPCARHRIVVEGRGDELAVVVVDGVLVQRLADRPARRRHGPGRQEASGSRSRRNRRRSR